MRLQTAIEFRSNFVEERQYNQRHRSTRYDLTAELRSSNAAHKTRGFPGARMGRMV